MRIRLTWSRFTSNPAEHVANPFDEFWTPLCGALINPDRQSFGETPSGTVPVCKRCVIKMFQFTPIHRGCRRSQFFGITIRKSDGLWVAETELDGEAQVISKQPLYYSAQHEAVEHVKTYPAVREILSV